MSNNIPQLTYETPVRAAAWYDDITVSVWTLAGYAAKSNRPLAELVERAIRLGHEQVGTIYTGTVLLGDRGAAERLRRERMELAARAVTLASGDRVEIDGVPYIVRFARGNETGRAPINSDPIKFDRA
jgi:hypothetical protein